MTNFGKLNIDNWCGVFRTDVRPYNLKSTLCLSSLNLLAEVACAAR